MKGNCGSLKGKSGGKTSTKGYTETITKTKDRKTKDINESIVSLREALFTPGNYEL